MTNAEYCIQHDIKFSSIEIQQRKRKEGGGYRIISGNKVLGEYKDPDGIYLNNNSGGFKYYLLRKWLDIEYKEDETKLLLPDEKQYLDSVIEPFAYKYDMIWFTVDQAFDCIIIHCKDDGDVEYQFNIPKAGRYENLKPGKPYSTDILKRSAIVNEMPMP